MHSRGVSTEPLPSRPARLSGCIQRQPDPGSPTHPPSSSQLWQPEGWEVNWWKGAQRGAGCIGCRELRCAGTAVSVLCLLWRGSVAVMANRRGQAVCWGRAGQGCRNLATTRACRAPRSLQEPQPSFLPMAAWQRLPGAQRREAERAGLLAGLFALAHPLSPWLAEGCRGGNVPMELHVHDQGCRTATVHCHCSGHRLGASGAGQQCLPSSPSTAVLCEPLALF